VPDHPVSVCAGADLGYDHPWRFPPLLLNPVNFDALFAKAMQQRKEADAATEEVKH
jgi:hypothetical protein